MNGQCIAPVACCVLGFGWGLWGQTKHNVVVMVFTCSVSPWLRLCIYASHPQSLHF